jgi:protein-tyrosine phosphatase
MRASLAMGFRIAQALATTYHAGVRAAFESGGASVRSASRRVGSRGLFILSILAFASCAPQQPSPVLLRSSAVERVSPDELRIRWPHAFTTGEVNVFSGRSPQKIDHKKPIAVGRDGTAMLYSPRQQRMYFELVPKEGGHPQLVAERRLPLEGSRNFRDLGGYRTADGRMVRWGRIYRSDELAALSDADIDYLRRLGIRLVCDFRSDDERASVPSREFTKRHESTINLAVQSKGMDAAMMRRKIRSGGIIGIEMEHTLQAAYASYVTDYTETWAALFERISNPKNLPAVLHCTAGKDRTGFASALVLLALGVPKETVYEDYMLTNAYLESFRRFVLRWTPLYSFFRTGADDLLPLLEARRVYLETSLATIDTIYGSLDAYLENQLHVDAKRRAALEANLLI